MFTTIMVLLGIIIGFFLGIWLANREINDAIAKGLKW